MQRKCGIPARKGGGYGTGIGVGVEAVLDRRTQRTEEAGPSKNKQ